MQYHKIFDRDHIIRSPTCRTASSACCLVLSSIPQPSNPQSQYSIYCCHLFHEAI